MLKKHKINYTVFEHSKLFVGSSNDPAHQKIDKRTFDDILELSFSSKDIDGEDIEQFVEIGYQQGNQYLKFNNYVGSISLPCGATFEILPKIFNRADDFSYARKTVLKMLEASSYVRFRTKQEGLTDLEKLPIFEIYIRLFINEVDILIKRGLKFSYVETEENLNTLQGKLIFNKHIEQNVCHKERFYVEHDVFDINRPENKIIKSALLLLKSISKDSNNSSDIKRLLLNMDSISQSSNIKDDLSKCLIDRNVAEYKEAIKYAKIFLLGYSFSIYSGKENCISLLFPAELLYQEYVFHHVDKYLTPKGFKVSRQDTSLYLFTEPRKFQLRPDILVTKDNLTFVLDTKWKIIEKERDISQADMYQMYAYHRRYQNVKKVVLLYPFTIPKDKFVFKSLDDVLIEASFVKLLIEDNKAEFIRLLDGVFDINK